MGRRTGLHGPTFRLSEFPAFVPSLPIKVYLSMKIAITGLGNSGKTTVFNALTGLSVETTSYASTGGEPRTGVVGVPDERIKRLSELFRPKKTTRSTIRYVDYVGLAKGDAKQNRGVFEFIKDADVLLHVVRAFEDDAVAHPLGGGVSPLRDIKTVEEELLFGDLELVERRLEAMELAGKRGKKPDEGEKKALLKCREALEAETPLRDVSFSDEDAKSLRHLQFMTIKPEVVALNVGEEDLNSEKAARIEKEARDFYGEKPSVCVLTLSGKIESEIAGLSGEERKAFLDDLGIKEPALEKLIRVSYGLLGYISFFTTGSDEVRAWAVKRGTDAQSAAGKIHTDIQRGFIRAEVVAYEDFMREGGVPEAREKGLLRLEGKSYEVKDGDMINFRFNV